MNGGSTRAKTSKLFPQECPARVSCKSVPRECPTTVSHKSVARVSHKSVPQKCPTKVTRPEECPVQKSVPQEFSTRVSQCLARVEQRTDLEPQECPARDAQEPCMSAPKSFVLFCSVAFWLKHLWLKPDRTAFQPIRFFPCSLA